MSDVNMESWETDVDIALMYVRGRTRRIGHLRFYLETAFKNLKSHYEDNDMDFWETIYDLAKYWLEGTYPDNSPLEEAIHTELLAFISQIPSWQLLAKDDLHILLELGAQPIDLDEVMQHLTMAERHERNVKLHIRVLLYALEHKPTHSAIEDYIDFLEEDYEDWKMRISRIRSLKLKYLIYAFSYDASWIPLAAAWRHAAWSGVSDAAAKRIQRMYKQWRRHRRQTRQRAASTRSGQPPAKRFKPRLRF